MLRPARFLVSGSGVRAEDDFALEFRISGFGFFLSGFGFRVSRGFGFRVLLYLLHVDLGFMCQVLGSRI